MQNRFLYPRQRQMEIMAALFAAGFGAFCGSYFALHNKPPMAWTGLSDQQQWGYSAMMMTSAVVHGVGIRINGRWWGSAMLRTLAMATFTMMIGWLAWKADWTTGTYTYGWITAALVVGAANAAKDTRTAWRTRWTQN